MRTCVSTISLKTQRKRLKPSCVQIVKDVLAELGAPSNIKFHAILCIGKRETVSEESIASQDTAGQSRPRPIVVLFVSCMDADCVWMNRKKLLKSFGCPTLLIYKDLSVDSARERGQLRTAYKKAKELNIEKVYIRGSSDSY